MEKATAYLKEVNIDVHGTEYIIFEICRIVWHQKAFFRKLSGTRLFSFQIREPAEEPNTKYVVSALFM